MKYLVLLLIIVCGGCSRSENLEPDAESSGRWVIWSALPACQWEDAFVTGNGRHGTMVWGRPNDERIVCVHEELFVRGWDHHKKTVPVTAQLLPEVRRLIDAGKTDEADRLITLEADRQLKEMGAEQRWPLIPHPAFDLHIRHMDTAVSVFCQGADGVEESVFSSRTDNVNVIRLKAGKIGKVDVALGLEETPGRHGSHFEHNLDSAFIFVESGAESGWLTYRAGYRQDTGGYEGLARVTLKGGNMKSEGPVLKVEDADEVLIVVRITPLADGKVSEEKETRRELSALPVDYDKLLLSHRKEHGEMFCRMQLDLGCASDWKNIPVEQMLATIHEEGITPLFRG